MKVDRKQVLATVIPVAVIVVGIIVKWIDAPNAIRDFFRSGRAFGLVVLAAIVWIGLMLVLWRFTNAWVRGGVMTAISLAAMALFIIPSLGDTVVVEERDDIAAARVGPDQADMAPAAEGMEEPEPTGPVQISTGEIVGIDHRAAGTANVYREPDGTYTLELFEIDIEPGPDLFVWVVPGDDQRGTDGGYDLGLLRGNVGTQFYEVPEGVDLEGDWTMLVWCRAFAVPFANATQVPIS